MNFYRGDEEVSTAIGAFVAMMSAVSWAAGLECVGSSDDVRDGLPEWKRL